MSNQDKKNMNCNIIRDLLPIYCDGQASDDSVNAVEQHLKECEECKKIYAEMSSEDAVIDKGEEASKSNREIDVLKKVRRRNWLKIVFGILAGMVVCAVLFVFLFVGVIPVKSEDITVTYEAYIAEGMVMPDDEASEKNMYCVEFHFELDSDTKVLGFRSEQEQYDARDVEKVMWLGSNSSEIKLYSQFKLPLDNRGDYPNQISYGVSSDQPFTDEDVFVVHFRDKSVTYHLKSIAEEMGIQ